MKRPDLKGQVCYHPPISATPTTTVSGIPVSEGTTGDILIGSNPIINQGSPSQVSVTAGSSVILTSGGGKVNITAPAVPLP